MEKIPAKSNVEYIYVLTREDLPQPHRTVQVAHAVLAASVTYGHWNRPHPFMVVLTVKDETELNDTFNWLKESGVPCCGYYEPDMGQALTAVATAPLKQTERKRFRKFRLMK